MYHAAHAQRKPGFTRITITREKGGHVWKPPALVVALSPDICIPPYHTELFISITDLPLTYVLA